MPVLPEHLKMLQEQLTRGEITLEQYQEMKEMFEEDQPELILFFRKAKETIGPWIEQDYNRLYPHSALGYRSPEEFEAMLVYSGESGSWPLLVLVVIRWLEPSEDRRFQLEKAAWVQSHPTAAPKVAKTRKVNS